MYPRISRRRFLVQSGQLALGASAVGSLLTACGSQTPAGNSGKPSGTVNYWIGLDDVQQRQYVKASDIDAFNKTHPGISVNVSFKPVDGIDRLIQIALPAGNGPDLVTTPGPSYALQYITANLLLDLDKYAQQYN
jgi:raffinose/stachyose/melibiose transport system substrate-binding protein